MDEVLRVHVFGVLRGVLLLVLHLPESSNFRSVVTSEILLHSTTTTSILSNHLSVTDEPREIQVILFDLMSLHCEFRSNMSFRLKSEAFVESMQIMLPYRIERLCTSAIPMDMDLALVNAQLVFLSKITSPVPNTMPRSAFEDPVAMLDNRDLVTKALELVRHSRLFSILPRVWPPETDRDIERIRALQPTVRLGLNLMLHILHRDGSPGIQDSVSQLFLAYRPGFEASLKMGQARRIVDREWHPQTSDREIAQLIEKLIQNSAVQTQSDVMAGLKPLLPSQSVNM